MTVTVDLSVQPSLGGAMRIRTGIAAVTVMAAATVFGGSTVSAAADAPQAQHVIEHPTSIVAGDVRGGEGDGPTGLGVNLLCGIGVLGQGSCSN